MPRVSISEAVVVDGGLTPPPSTFYPGRKCYMVTVTFGGVEHFGFGPSPSIARAAAIRQVLASHSCTEETRTSSGSSPPPTGPPQSPAHMAQGCSHDTPFTTHPPYSQPSNWPHAPQMPGSPLLSTPQPLWPSYSHPPPPTWAPTFHGRPPLLPSFHPSTPPFPSPHPLSAFRPPVPLPLGPPSFHPPTPQLPPLPQHPPLLYPPPPSPLDPEDSSSEDEDDQQISHGLHEVVPSPVPTFSPFNENTSLLSDPFQFTVRLPRRTCSSSPCKPPWKDVLTDVNSPLDKMQGLAKIQTQGTQAREPPSKREPKNVMPTHFLLQGVEPSGEEQHHGGGQYWEDGPRLVSGDNEIVTLPTEGLL